MQGWETGVRAAALQLHKQSFFGWTGEVPSPLEGPIGAPRALILLEDISKSFHFLQLCTLQRARIIVLTSWNNLFIPQANLIKYHIFKNLATNKLFKVFILSPVSHSNIKCPPPKKNMTGIEPVLDWLLLKLKSETVSAVLSHQLEPSQRLQQARGQTNPADNTAEWWIFLHLHQWAHL